MPVDLRYRGRVVTAEDIVFIRQFIAESPGLSRRKLSAKLCEAWQWKQANGALCDMVCRGLLLMLHSGRRDRAARDSSDLAQSVCAKKQAATGSDRHLGAQRRTH